MKSAHFFDIDILLKTDGKVWIIDKTSPNIPIMKISKSDFSLIKNGIYRSQGNSIVFSGHTYWLSTALYDKLKIKSKNTKSDLSNLAFSMQEFTNKSIIDKLQYEINVKNIQHLKNSNDDIYIICSRNNKKNYGLAISKLEESLSNIGLKVKNYYHISETFYNRDGDDITYKKVRLILQHSIGYKTDGDKFTDEKLDQYDNLYYYDDDRSAIKLSIDSNKFLMILLSNTDKSIVENIKSELKLRKHELVINLYTNNNVNRFEITEVYLQYSNLIKTFESFKYQMLVESEKGNIDIIRNIKDCFQYVSDICHVGFKPTETDVMVSINLDNYLECDSYDPTVLNTSPVKKSKYGKDYRPVKRGVEIVGEVSESISKCLGVFSLKVKTSRVDWINAGESGSVGMLTKGFAPDGVYGDLEYLTKGKYSTELLEEFIISRGDRVRYINIVFSLF